MNVTTQASNLESMQALMLQMQESLQHQIQQQQQQQQQLLQQQQHDFQIRMEHLLVGKGKAVELPLPPGSNESLASIAQAIKTPLPSHSNLSQVPEIDENLIGIASNEPLQDSPYGGREWTENYRICSGRARETKWSSRPELVVATKASGRHHRDNCS
jgi:hypothetical protein